MHNNVKQIFQFIAVIYRVQFLLFVFSSFTNTNMYKDFYKNCKHESLIISLGTK